MAAPGDVFDGRYRIHALLARGGMADVYRAHDERLGRDVAVKVLREVEHQERFAVEARTLARLNHPNLVALLDAGTHGDAAYLVLELLGGETVATLLQAGPLGPERSAEIGVAVGGALAYIHEREIVHRDVKPSNLMLDDRGTVRLADFGIARLIGGASLTGTQQTVGTMAYLAPEQLRGELVTSAADVYSLGLVLLECLTGRRVFEGTPVEAGMARLASDPSIPASLPPPWRPLLASMTAGDARYRPSAEQVAHRLQGREPGVGPAVAAPLGAAATPTMAATRAGAAVPPTRTAVASGPPVRRRKRRRGGLLLGLAAAALLLVLIAVIGFNVLRDRGDGDSEPSPTSTTEAPGTTTETVPATTAPPVTTTVPPTTTTVPVTQPDNEGPDGGDGGGPGPTVSVPVSAP
jgi:eukaryotic-like serine/threonine-protein kinase